MKYALHIGINEYDEAIYGQYASLNACVADAFDMQCQTKKNKVENSTILLDRQANRAAVINALNLLAFGAVSGDTVIITYSSHGTQVKDIDQDELDGLDEAVCLHNGLLYDDEIYDHLTKFKKGVLVLIYSDTCHAEDQIRASFPTVTYRNKSKFIRTVREYFQRNKMRGVARSKKIVCKVIQFGACASSATALDGELNGYFTEHVLKVLNYGAVVPRYKQFFNHLKESMGPLQVPTISKHNISIWSNPRVL